MKIGKIYKIISTQGTECYVGSTFDTTRNRFQQHKSNYKQRKNKCIVSEMFDKYGIDNCRMLLIKEYEVIDRRHLEVYETLWIKKLKAINKVQPSGGILKKHYLKQFYEDNKKTILEKAKIYRVANKEAIAEKDKKYRENNKQKISEKGKERITCECGIEVCRGRLTQHKKTKKHLNKIQ